MKRHAGLIRVLIAIALGLIKSEWIGAHGAAPVVDYLFPAGGQAGSTVSVSIGGKFDPWPPKIWSSTAELNSLASEEEGKLSISISTNAPVGPHLVRFYNEEGASAPICFVVGRLGESLEKEPNDEAVAAESIAELPATINGRLNKDGDADSFAIELDAGQWLIASVDAYSLDSPVDPLLHLLDGEGTKLAFNHDGPSLDPFLTFRAKTAGTYVLQLSAFAYPPKADVRLTGGDSCVYRLTISTGPVARYAYPSGIRRGGKSALHVVGWNFPTESQSIVLQADASECGPGVNSFPLSVPGTHNDLMIPMDDWPEILENEPNDENPEATPVEIPCVVNGRVDPEGDEDRFRVAVKKGERIGFEVQSHSLGFPLDAVLSVYDSTGKRLAGNDDAGKVPDPELKWTVPSDGLFTLGIRDLIDRGGMDFVYRLKIVRPRAGFDAQVLGDRYAVESGNRVEVKVKATRLNDFEGRLTILADELPEGVSCTAASVSSEGGEVTLALSATEDAAPANCPIRFVAVVMDPNDPQVRVVRARLKGKNAAEGDLLINEIDHVWLTVIPKPEENEPPAGE